MRTLARRPQFLADIWRCNDEIIKFIIRKYGGDLYWPDYHLRTTIFRILAENKLHILVELKDVVNFDGILYQFSFTEKIRIIFISTVWTYFQNSEKWMLACEKVTQDDRMIDLHSIYVTIEQDKFLVDASRAISLAKKTFKLHNDHYQGQLMQNSRALKAFISQIEGFAGIEELRIVFNKYYLQ